MLEPIKSKDLEQKIKNLFSWASEEIIEGNYWFIRIL